MSVPWALAIPVIIFLGVIVPIWITFHYITVWLRMRASRGADRPSASQEMEELQAAAQRLERRIESLESVLDVQEPQWRQR